MSWTRQGERGGAAALRLMLWIVRRLGFRVAHGLLWPVTLYFLLSAPAAQREASRRFLARALGRAPRFRDQYRQYLTFAATVLDRVLLLGGGAAGYRLDLTGVEALEARIRRGEGCILFGAHLGSFEALRAVGERGCPVEVVALMHQDNAAVASTFLDALGPRQAASVVPLGRPDAMLRAKECLERGGLVTVLADRAPPGTAAARLARVPFLGAPAAFPLGPHVLAAVLGAPVFLAFGIWRGPRRYEARFEPFADRIVLNRATRQADLVASVARYAARVEAVARENPENWFNFFDFWEELPAGAATARRPGWRPRRAAVRAGALAVLLGAGLALAETPLEAAMRALAARTSGQADFLEEKALPELALPLPSTGTLSWQAPDRLEKRTEDPIRERLTVEGDRLTFERPDQGIRRELSLDQSPELRPLVEAVRSTLAGDLATLRRYYGIGFEGDPAGEWRMVLTPLSARLRVAVQRIEVTGRADAVLGVVTQGSDGTTRMRITPRP